jgi:predicted nucleic acid-binding Zn ribbon protein
MAMTELSVLIPRALRQLPPTNELTEKLVISVWERAVGETLAQRTRPFRLHQSTLIVSVPSLMWKRELHHLQEEILEGLRKALGRTIVQALEFRVDVEFDSRVVASAAAPSQIPQKPILLALECIEDPELRRTFAATASSCLNRPK